MKLNRARRIHTLIRTERKNQPTSSLARQPQLQFLHHVVSIEISHPSFVCNDQIVSLMTRYCCYLHSASNTPGDHPGCRARIPSWCLSVVSSRLSWTLSLRGPSRRNVNSCAIERRSTGIKTYLLRVRVAGWFGRVGFGHLGV